MTTRNKVGDRTPLANASVDAEWLGDFPMALHYTLYVLVPALYQSPAFPVYTTLVEVSQKSGMLDGVKGLF